jgi:hypothetical protein
VTEFIGRNYARDERGCWYFQNGPQRVFVNLDYTPFVYRVVSPDGAPLALEAHNGKPVATVSGAWMDENGALVLDTDLGAGVAHDRDLDRILPHFVDANGNPLPEEALDPLMEEAERGGAVPLWLKFRESNVKVEPLLSREVGQRFGHVAQPVPPEGEEVCK